MPLARRNRRTFDIWPGFVDALATLVMVIVFVLMVFVMAQYYLGLSLSGRQKAVDRLGAQLAELAERLNLETVAKTRLEGEVGRLTAELNANRSEREQIESKLAGINQELSTLLGQKNAIESKLTQREGELDAERKVSGDAQAQVALLTRQIEALRNEVARIAAALDASEARDREQKTQIADLGKRLNVALAGKVEELQKFRSDFFGRLRKVLGDHPGIRIEGDRFVFQSELLFKSASAELGPEGVEQVARLAATLKEISRTIPPEVNWVLRVDGHTDQRPIISSGRYRSNWELSTARAITVLRALSANGIPNDRLAAAGFGEFQPLDTARTEEAYARNRRIEIRFDQR